MEYFLICFLPLRDSPLLNFEAVFIVEILYSNPGNVNVFFFLLATCYQISSVGVVVCTARNRLPSLHTTHHHPSLAHCSSMAEIPAGVASGIHRLVPKPRQILPGRQGLY
jgi:hypothetical protein